TAYACSDIFFFPSDTETFGNVTLEAMASGLPCLVADAQGSKSLVKHDYNGFIVPVEKKEAFYRRAKELVENKELRKEMASHSLERSFDFTWEKINSRLLDNYRSVIGKSSNS
ncbi:MAG: glycosyltransferase, partial [Balneolaceae bacterium]